VQTSCLNGRRRFTTPIHRIRIARAASQPGIGADLPAATGLNKPFGHGTVPTFFWGGEATTAAHQGIGERLNQMGVWRDTDRSQ